jgi:hypothetical protein
MSSGRRGAEGAGQSAGDGGAAAAAGDGSGDVMGSAAGDAAGVSVLSSSAESARSQASAGQVLKWRGLSGTCRLENQVEGKLQCLLR